MEQEHGGSPAKAPPIVCQPETPFGGDPVVAPTNNDVLCGRGGAVNGHPGNVRLRALVGTMKAAYHSPQTRKSQKAQIAAAIVRTIRALDPPGQFLRANPSTGRWYEIGDAAATRKCSQALREDAAACRARWREILARGDATGEGPDAQRGAK